MTVKKTIKTTIEVTDREAQMLLDAIRFIWKSGAVTSRGGAGELIALEDRIEKTIVAVKGEAHG